MKQIYPETVSIALILIWLTLIDSVYVSGSAHCSCYSFDGDHLRKWSGAQKICTDNNGDLVSMETLGEWEFIKEQIQKKATDSPASDEWWIGLEKRDEKWEWLSNHSLTYNKWQYSNPHPQGYVHVIIAKSFPAGTYGLFRNKPDHLTRGTICEYKAPEQCVSSLNRVSWCYPTTEPPSSTAPTITSIPSQTTKASLTTTGVAGGGNHSPIPHHTSFSTDSPVKGAKKSFPTEIVASVISVLLISTCIVILVCIWKRRKQERKPRRNSHLNKKSRVPVKLEHSESSNTNDLINASDVTFVSDTSMHPEPAYASINDHQVKVNDGMGKETVPLYASVKKNKTKEQQQTSQNQAVVYAELNAEEQAATQNSYQGNKELDSISYENEFQVNKVDEQKPFAKEGIQPEDNKLVYAQLEEFKDNDQQQSTAKMPSPYKGTEYATIMTPILSNRSKSKENITQI